MNSIKKVLSVLLVIAMLVAACVSVSVTSKADDEVAYAFSSSKWAWWGCAQGTVNGSWGQNDNALTRNYSEGAVTYDVSGVSDTALAFQQIQDKWQSMPAGDFYLNFTNNASLSVEVKIEASVKLFDVWVPAGATQKIEFSNETASEFSLFVMNWGTTIPGGTGLFTFSPIYYQPTAEETTVETAAPSGNEVLYKFSSANHNYSKTEGCNPNNSWAWGTFATNTLTHNSDGSVVVNTTAGDYDKFRQFNSNWNNVPAITDTAYIDITNNSTRTLKVKIVTSGYSTPADSELPTVAAGNTITLELGALAGGTIQVMLQESGGADQIECKDEIFVFSGIYKKAEETKFKVTLDGTEVGKYSDGETYTLPVNPSSSFVGFTDGANLYYMGEEITVDSNIDLTSLDLGLKMESGASIRYSTPTGLRFYTGINKDVLTKLEELGASVKLGTLISTSDLIGEETFDLNMTKQFVQIPYNSRNWFKENDFSGFVGSIVSIKTANLNRNFVGRGYAEISCGEFYKEIYADYYDSDMYNNSRSICYVAKMIKESETYDSLNESQKTIIDDFVSSYID